MLIIEIALGIVLAVIIINYWRDIINFGVVAVIGLVILSVLFGIGYLIYDGWDSITPFLPLLLTVICFVIGVLMLHKVCDFLEAKLSKITIKVWNLTGGESIGVLFVMIVLAVGIYLVLKTAIMENPPHNYLPIGFLLIIIGSLTYKSTAKSIKKSRILRDTKKTYDE